MLIKSIELYFVNPDINLPLFLFVKIIKFYLIKFNYTEARYLIENYLIYSSLKKTSNSILQKKTVIIINFFLNY
jgi:hypothetical protein